MREITRCGGEGDYAMQRRGDLVMPWRKRCSLHAVSRRGEPAAVFCKRPHRERVVRASSRTHKVETFTAGRRPRPGATRPNTAGSGSYCTTACGRRGVKTSKWRRHTPLSLCPSPCPGARAHRRACMQAPTAAPSCAPPAWPGPPAPRRHTPRQTAGGYHKRLVTTRCVMSGSSSSPETAHAPPSPLASHPTVLPQSPFFCPNHHPTTPRTMLP